MLDSNHVPLAQSALFGIDARALVANREHSTASRSRLRDHRGKWRSSVDPDGKCEPPNHYECACVGPSSCGHPTQSAPGVLASCMDAATQFPDNFNGTETGFATTRRNFFRGPNYFNSDFDVLKNFKVAERVTFAVGANFYNVFNHPNFAPPNADVNNVFAAPFGTITSTVTPTTSIYGAFVGSAVSGRVVQLHAKLEF
jgi:hypothetical protein